MIICLVAVELFLVCLYKITRAVSKYVLSTVKGEEKRLVWNYTLLLLDKVNTIRLIGCTLYKNKKTNNNNYINDDDDDDDNASASTSACRSKNNNGNSNDTWIRIIT